jgi:hypothetical protein
VNEFDVNGGTRVSKEISKEEVKIVGVAEWGGVGIRQWRIA